MANPDRLTALPTPALGRLAQAAPAALLLFVAAAFALPKEPAYALVFYVASAPCVLALLAVRPPRLSAAAWLAVALILWSGATLLWGVDDGDRSLKFLRDTLCTLLFLLGLAAVAADAAWRSRLRLLLGGAGGVSAVFAIVLGLTARADEARLHGWGATLHPILGGQVMVATGLTATWLALTARQPARRALWLVAAALMAAFVVMTESRGPILSGAIAVTLLCAAGPWRLFALPSLAALAGVWWLLPGSVQSHGTAVMMARGTSHRLEIWDEALRMIGDRPVLGHGLAANMHMEVPDGAGTLPITFPHDLYLSLLFYSGAVGLALFLGLVAVLAAGLWRRRAEPETLWLGCLLLAALLGGLTDLGQITKGPGPLWLILWLPAGMLCAMAAPLRLTRGQAARAPALAVPAAR